MPDDVDNTHYSTEQIEEIIKRMKATLLAHGDAEYKKLGMNPDFPLVENRRRYFLLFGVKPENRIIKMYLHALTLAGKCKAVHGNNLGMLPPMSEFSKLALATAYGSKGERESQSPFASGKVKFRERSRNENAAIADAEAQLKSDNDALAKANKERDEAREQLAREQRRAIVAIKSDDKDSEDKDESDKTESDNKIKIKQS